MRFLNHETNLVTAALETLRHYLNPLNGIYTSLRSMGMAHKTAMQWSGWYERNIYRKVLG